jgi:hypothetical protein
MVFEYHFFYGSYGFPNYISFFSQNQISFHKLESTRYFIVDFTLGPHWAIINKINLDDEQKRKFYK